MTCFSFTYSGRQIVTGYVNGMVMIRDTLSGRLEMVLLTGRSDITSIAATPDDKLILFTKRSPEALYWDENQPYHYYATVPLARPTVSFSPDSVTFVADGNKHKTFDISNGFLIQWDVAPHYYYFTTITSYARTIAAGRDDGIVDLFNTEMTPDTRQPMPPLNPYEARCIHSAPLASRRRGSDRSISAITFGFDGRILIAANRYGETFVLDSTDLSALQNLKGNGMSVHALASDPDSRRIARCINVAPNKGMPHRAQVNEKWTVEFCDLDIDTSYYDADMDDGADDDEDDITVVGGPDDRHQDIAVEGYSVEDDVEKEKPDIEAGLMRLWTIVCAILRRLPLFLAPTQAHQPVFVDAFTYYDELRNANYQNVMESLNQEWQYTGAMVRSRLCHHAMNY